MPRISWASLANGWGRYFRLPIVLATLAIILYYTAFLYQRVPFLGFFTAWKPDNVLSVVELLPERHATEVLQQGDILVAIDDVLVQQRVLRPLFTPDRESYTYTILRSTETLTLTIPVETPTFEKVFGVLKSRLATGMVSFSFWLIGSLVILFATPQNRDAWLLGVVTLGTSVVLTASEAALYNAPGAWLLSNPFYPVLGVAWMHLAFVPRLVGWPVTAKRTFLALYGAAIVFGLIASIELLYLMPQGKSIELLFGVSYYSLLLLALVIGAIVNLLILLWRSIHMAASYERQQVRVILLFTALALLPGLSLTFWPWLLLDNPVLSWSASFLVLVLIPAGYAYVIYRRNYLQLDIFITQTLTAFLITVMLIGVYSLFTHLLRDHVVLQDLGIPAGLVATPFLLIIPYASRPVRRTVQGIVYGDQEAYQENLGRFAAQLSASPQQSTLQTVFREAMNLMQVGRAALLLTIEDEILRCVASIRADDVPELPVQSLNWPARASLQLRERDNIDALHPLLAREVWVEALVPLIAQNQLVGVLLLGQKVPDGYFHDQDVAFVRQLADNMAVSALNIRLFDASRIMSRKLLQIREQERHLLAAQIHDEPLQRVTLLAHNLQRLASQASPLEAAQLLQHSNELRVVAGQLRTTCAGLYPPVLQQGLQWAVRESVHHFSLQGDWQIGLRIELGNEVLVSSNVATSAYHVLVEALTNVRKHAAATMVAVRLWTEENRLYLLVEDNGVGNGAVLFSVPDLLRRKHFGLVGMCEWANIVGGQLSLQRRQGGGTTVCLMVPPPWLGE